MKNKKALILVAVMVVSLLFGSAQVYAASNNISLSTLIKQLFDDKGNEYVNAASGDMDKINNASRDSIRSELSNIDKEIEALNDYEKEQVAAGEAQMKQYTDSVKGVIKENINQGKDSAKGKIKGKVDEKVAEGKAMIDAEISKYIQSNIQ